MKNIVLFGIKHCGKTTYGKKLATKLGQPFIDTDDLIEKMYHKKYNEQLSLRQIINKHGVKLFEELEQKVVASLANTTNTIIAVGGSTLLNPANLELLKNNSTLTYLKIDAKIAFKRILQTGIPSFLDKNNLEQSFADYVELRTKFYSTICDKAIVATED